MFELHLVDACNLSAFHLSGQPSWNKGLSPIGEQQEPMSFDGTGVAARLAKQVRFLSSGQNPTVASATAAFDPAIGMGDFDAGSQVAGCHLVRGELLRWT